jgi:lipopolysaccharide biosynthesis regulator YciM
MLILVTVVLISFLVFLQTRYQKKEAEEPAREKQEKSDKGASAKLPPDLEAYYATYRITDPEKRIEAIEKFIADFPKSSQTESARRQIFRDTIKRWPEDKKEMLDAAERLLNPSSGDDKKASADASIYAFLAGELFDAGIFLDEAERFSSKSLEYSDKAKFMEGLKKTYEGWKRPIPSEEVANKQYLKELASYRTTLGRIHLKKGKEAEGERMLKEAYATDPTLAQAAIGLAEIAEKRGDNAAALDYLTPAVLTAGYKVADAVSRFEALYRKMHKGSLDGSERMLDSKYKELFPNPIKVGRYKPMASRSDRVVLAELFSGAG